MTWDPPCPSDPHLVPLTERMQRVIGSGETPEALLIAREDIADERRTLRKLSRRMQMALQWLATEDTSRMFALIDWALPLAEAYMLRRYLLGGERSVDIAADLGVSGAGVRYRLKRAVWRLRQVQDVAWDVTEDEMRRAVGELLSAKDVHRLVIFWRERFSQSRTAAVLGTRQSTVQSFIARIARELGGVVPLAKAKDLRRIQRTLVEVQRRKLWNLATPLPLKHSVKMPGGSAA